MKLDQALDRLARLEIELPSWAFGNSGTRFKVFTQAGCAADPRRRSKNAAQMHRFTGCRPLAWRSTSLGIEVDDYAKLRRARR